MCDARLQTFNMYFTTGTSFWCGYCVGDQSTDCSFTFIFLGMKRGTFVNQNNKKFTKEIKYHKKTPNQYKCKYQVITMNFQQHDVLFSSKLAPKDYVIIQYRKIPKISL